jgi:hypothetical protein
VYRLADPWLDTPCTSYMRGDRYPYRPRPGRESLIALPLIQGLCAGPLIAFESTALCWEQGQNPRLFSDISHALFVAIPMRHVRQTLAVSVIMLRFWLADRL